MEYYISKQTHIKIIEILEKEIYLTCFIMWCDFQYND